MSDALEETVILPLERHFAALMNAEILVFINTSK